ncbi:hypothetical protein AB1Y20_004886 [Prymnesium parvum]|uniref:Uncharacterized protein n=1 Tax=Prymnesium parvum TaxID=97485 RepID=A0AB34J028_PRYPA
MWPSLPGLPPSRGKLPTLAAPPSPALPPHTSVFALDRRSPLSVPASRQPLLRPPPPLTPALPLAPSSSSFPRVQAEYAARAPRLHAALAPPAARVPHSASLPVIRARCTRFTRSFAPPDAEAAELRRARAEEHRGRSSERLARQAAARHEREAAAARRRARKQGKAATRLQSHARGLMARRAVTAERGQLAAEMQRQRRLSAAKKIQSEARRRAELRKVQALRRKRDAVLAQAEDRTRVRAQQAAHGRERTILRTNEDFFEQMRRELEEDSCRSIQRFWRARKNRFQTEMKKAAEALLREEQSRAARIIQARRKNYLKRTRSTPAARWHHAEEGPEVRVRPARIDQLGGSAGAYFARKDADVGACQRAEFELRRISLTQGKRTSTSLSTQNLGREVGGSERTLKRELTMSSRTFRCDKEYTPISTSSRSIRPDKGIDHLTKGTVAFNAKLARKQAGALPYKASKSQLALPVAEGCEPIDSSTCRQVAPVEAAAAPPAPVERSGSKPLPAVATAPSQPVELEAEEKAAETAVPACIKAQEGEQADDPSKAQAAPHRGEVASCDDMSMLARQPSAPQLPGSASTPVLGHSSSKGATSEALDEPKLGSLSHVDTAAAPAS